MMYTYPRNFLLNHETCKLEHSSSRVTNAYLGLLVYSVCVSLLVFLSLPAALILSPENTTKLGSSLSNSLLMYSIVVSSPLQSNYVYAHPVNIEKIQHIVNITSDGTSRQTPFSLVKCKSAICNILNSPS